MYDVLPDQAWKMCFTVAFSLISVVTAESMVSVQPINVEEGTDLCIPCPGLDPDALSWTQIMLHPPEGESQYNTFDYQTRNDKQPNIVVWENGTLHISSIEIRNEGVYHCTDLIKRMSFNVSVFVKPSKPIIDIKRRVKTGNKIKTDLACSVLRVKSADCLVQKPEWTIHKTNIPGKYQNESKNDDGTIRLTSWLHVETSLSARQSISCSIQWKVDDKTLFFTDTVVVGAKAVPEVQPRILPNPAIEGQDITFSCTVTNPEIDHTCQWTKKNGAHTIAISRSGVWYSKSVRRSMSGIYCCHTYNKTGGKMEECTKLEIFYKPGSIKLTASPDPPVIGHKLELHCAASGGYPPVYTYALYHVTSLRKNTTLAHSSVYRIDPLQEAIGGEIVCEVTNGAGVVKTSKRLGVQKPVPTDAKADKTAFQELPIIIAACCASLVLVVVVVIVVACCVHKHARKQRAACSKKLPEVDVSKSKLRENHYLYAAPPTPPMPPPREPIPSPGKNTSDYYLEVISDVRAAATRGNKEGDYYIILDDDLVEINDNGDRQRISNVAATGTRHTKIQTPLVLHRDMAYISRASDPNSAQPCLQKSVGICDATSVSHTRPSNVPPLSKKGKKRIGAFGLSKSMEQLPTQTDKDVLLTTLEALPAATKLHLNDDSANRAHQSCVDQNVHSETYNSDGSKSEEGEAVTEREKWVY